MGLPNMKDGEYTITELRGTSPSITRREFMRIAGAFGFTVAIGTLAIGCGENIEGQAEAQAGQENAKAAQAEYTIVYSVDGLLDSWPEGPVTKTDAGVFGVVELKKNIEKHSDGRIYVDLREGAPFGGQLTMAQKLQSGIIEAGMFSTQNASNYSPVWSATDVPYSLGDSLDGYWKILYSKEVNDTLRESSKASGLMPLMIFPQFRWMGMREGLGVDVRVPTDLSGLKTRVTGSSFEQAAFSILPSNSFPLGWGEVYTALSEGAIDGIHVSPAGMTVASIYTVLKEIVDVNFMFDAIAHWMSASFFDSLPSDLQEAVLEGAFESQVWLQENTEALERKQMGIRRGAPQSAIYPAEGVEVKLLSEKQRDEWKEVLSYENNRRRYDQILEQADAVREQQVVAEVANSEGPVKQERWWK